VFTSESHEATARAGRFSDSPSSQINAERQARSRWCYKSYSVSAPLVEEGSVGCSLQRAFLRAGGWSVRLADCWAGAWGPRFACAEPDFNCGDVPAAQTVEHEFVIGNVGRQPMKILKAAPGCSSCLTVQISDYEIAPGGTAKLKAVLRPGRLPVGAFEQRVWLETNSTNVPRITLFLRGIV